MLVGLGFFFLISISAFTCETLCPRVNYLPLSVYNLLLCVFLCVLYAFCACLTLSLCSFSSMNTAEVCDWQCESVRKFSVRKPTWISFRAGLQGGSGFRGERAGETVAESVRFRLKDSLYLAISGTRRVVGGEEGWRRDKGRESDPPAPGEGMNR